MGTPDCESRAARESLGNGTKGSATFPANPFTIMRSTPPLLSELTLHYRANSAQTRHSRPDSGFITVHFFHAKVFGDFESRAARTSLGNGTQGSATVPAKPFTIERIRQKQDSHHRANSAQTRQSLSSDFGKKNTVSIQRIRHKLDWLYSGFVLGHFFLAKVFEAFQVAQERYPKS